MIAIGPNCIQRPSDTYSLLVDYLIEQELHCEYASNIISQWAWRGNTALSLHQQPELIEVEIEPWVLDYLEDECGFPFTMPIFRIVEYDVPWMLKLFIERALPPRPEDQEAA